LSDDRLTELARAGSEHAFEVLVARHRPQLVRLCARIVGDGDAEEAVQEALIRAHGALERGAEVRSVSAWLRQIARNAALSLLRSRPRNVDCHWEGVTDAGLDQRLALGELREALDALAPRQREAIVMRELEGRSYAEIADRLGTSPGAVRQLLNRARIAIRRQLAAVLPWDALVRWAIVNPGAVGARVGAIADTCSAGARLCAALIPAAALSISGAHIKRLIEPVQHRVAPHATVSRVRVRARVVAVAPAAVTHVAPVDSRISPARQTATRIQTARQPTHVASRPRHVEPQQAVAQPTPTRSQSQPAPSQSQPARSQPQPTRSQPQPTSTQPQPTPQTATATPTPGHQYGSPPS
jgi:RNA polymerase sigma factor (sigma-70 family)